MGTQSFAGARKVAFPLSALVILLLVFQLLLRKGLHFY